MEKVVKVEITRWWVDKLTIENGLSRKWFIER
jgi:hypothetical protein